MNIQSEHKEANTWFVSCLKNQSGCRVSDYLLFSCPSPGHTRVLAFGLSPDTFFSVGLTAPHPDYEPALFVTKCQGHCPFLFAGGAFTFRNATGKRSRKRNGRDLQPKPTLLDIGYFPLFYIASYLYRRIPIFPYCHIGVFSWRCVKTAHPHTWMVIWQRTLEKVIKVECVISVIASILIMTVNPFWLIQHLEQPRPENRGEGHIQNIVYCFRFPTFRL